MLELIEHVVGAKVFDERRGVTEHEASHADREPAPLGYALKLATKADATGDHEQRAHQHGELAIIQHRLHARHYADDAGLPTIHK